MFDVAIIGGGIIGLMSAYELSKAGLSVVIIDKDQAGQGASSAGGGILSSLHPWLDTSAYQDFCLLNQQRYPKLVEELQEQTGIDPEYIVSGLLFLNPESENGFTNWLHNNNQAEIIKAGEISSYANIDYSSHDALWLSDVAQIRNPILIKALLEVLASSNVKLMEGKTVTNIQNQNGRIDFLQLDDEKVKAGNYILSAGAWSGDERFKASINMKPMRGQILCYQLGEKRLEKIVLKEGRYLIPRKDNILLIGSTLEDDGFNCITTHEAREGLQAFASSLLPELSGVEPYKQWAGLRPKIQGGMPCIDKHPEYENLYLNCGHFRNGLLTAPVSARMITDMILQKKPEFASEIFQYNSVLAA